MSISHPQDKTETMAYLHEHYTYESFYWKKKLLSILKLRKMVSKPFAVLVFQLS